MNGLTHGPDSTDSAPTDSITDLYTVASDDEKDVLDRLRRRAGHTWNCQHCEWINVAEDGECGNCGRAANNDGAGSPVTVSPVEIVITYCTPDQGQRSPNPQVVRDSAGRVRVWDRVNDRYGYADLVPTWETDSLDDTVSSDETTTRP